MNKLEEICQSLRTKTRFKNRQSRKHNEEAVEKKKRKTNNRTNMSKK